MVSVYLEAFPSEDQVLVSAVPVSEYPAAAQVSEYPVSAPVSSYPE